MPAIRTTISSAPYAFSTIAVRELHARGRRRLALVAPPSGLTYHGHTVNGFVDALNETGATEVPFNSVSIDQSIEQIRRRTAQIMRRDDRPDGFVSSASSATLAVAAGIEDAGLKVGRDVDVNFGDILDVLAGAALVHVEGGNGDDGVFGDFIWMSVEPEDEIATIGGVGVPLGGTFPQTVVDDATGKLVVTGFSFDATTGVGTVDYSYTLEDNTLLHGPGNNGQNTLSLPFEVVVKDEDGSSATASLDVTIVDDVASAAPDTDSVTEDAASFVADGNVLTGSGGADGQLISNLIAFHMSKSNWSLAAAIAGMLLASILLLYWLYDRLIGIDRLKFG